MGFAISGDAWPRQDIVVAHYGQVEACDSSRVGRLEEPEDYVLTHADSCVPPQVSNP